MGVRSEVQYDAASTTPTQPSTQSLAPPPSSTPSTNHTENHKRRARIHALLNASPVDPPVEASLRRMKDRDISRGIEEKDGRTAAAGEMPPLSRYIHKQKVKDKPDGAARVVPPLHPIPMHVTVCKAT